MKLDGQLFPNGVVNVCVNGKPLAGGTQAKPLEWTGFMLNSIKHEVRP